MLNTLLSIWTWSIIVLTLIVGTTLQIPLFLISRPFDPQRMLIGRYFRLLAVFAFKLIPTWHFRILGQYPPRIGQCVVICNHISYVDSFIIAHLPWEMKWMAKDTLAKIPFMGWGMRMAGDVAVSRGNKRSGYEAIQKLANYLRQGVPVCLFPEGTRSPDGELRAFKDGAFRLAIETQSDILPLAVWGTLEAMPKNSLRVSNAHALLKVGEAISTKGLSMQDLPALKEKARTQIQAMIDEMKKQKSSAS